MCPCFNVKDELSELLKEDEPEINEEPKETTEVPTDPESFESEEEIVTAQEPPTISEKESEEEKEESRPNPLYFVWEFVKLLFKIILRRK